MRGPSLRIRIHYARKQTPAGVLGRRLSGGRKRPAAVRFNRTIACVCIELLSQANGASYPQSQSGPLGPVDVLTKSPYSAAFARYCLGVNMRALSLKPQPF